MSELLLKKLTSLMYLRREERAVVLGLPSQSRTINARSDVAELVDNSDRSGVHMIEDGFACRYKFLANGRRQILCYLLPGDILDLRRFIAGRSQLPVASFSRLSLRVFPSNELLGILERHPRIARALWWATLAEESISQEWLVSIGQRSAIERMAHILCEIQVRLDTVGRTRHNTFEFPVTQSELADTLGLSTVHVNRTLQELRRRGHIVYENGTVSITDFDSLRSIALFSPSYLHLRSTELPASTTR